MENIKAKIGLEIHLGLNTKTKLFCGCPIVEGSEANDVKPNTLVCEVCLGHPGSKPVVNSKALEFVTKIAKALNCKLQKKIIFSRKSYFYPDMAKNYQITQYEEPLGVHGSVNLHSGKKIGITRVHIEEDPAAIVHEKNQSLVDYNRSGIALAEIVTEPDMNSAEEAREFMNKLRVIANYLEVYSPEGIIKADVNVSIAESGFQRVEIKNVSGFKEIEDAIEYEISRQRAAVKHGSKIIHETRFWDSDKKITISARTKETEADYGYIYEPDLLEYDVPKVEIPELAEDKAIKFIRMKIAEDTANILASDKEVAQLYEEVIYEKIIKINPVAAANWFRKEFLRVINEEKTTISDLKFGKKEIIELVSLLAEKKITEEVGREILDKLVEGKLLPKSPVQYVNEKGLQKVSDTGELEKFCEQAIKENPKAVADYKNGEEKALNFLAGQIMKKTQGKADVEKVKEILEKLVK